MCTPSAPLNDHFLIFLESEKSVTNKAGYIDNVFNLSGMTFGSNGYLVLAMKNTKYPALAGANNVMEAADFDVTTPAIATASTLAESKKTMASGANAYINRTSTSSVAGFGGVGNHSSIGHSKASTTASDAQIEGDGSTRSTCGSPNTWINQDGQVQTQNFAPLRTASATPEEKTRRASQVPTGEASGGGRGCCDGDLGIDRHAGVESGDRRLLCVAEAAAGDESILEDGGCVPCAVARPARA